MDVTDLMFIGNTNNRYIITKDAIIYDIMKEKQVIPRESKVGYLYCGIVFTDGYRSCAVHRLVAEAFIPNPEHKSRVNHIDAHKKHNCSYNLEWATSQENMNHVSINGLNPNSQKCCLVSSSDKIEKVFPTLSYAGREYRTYFSNIRECCKGTRNDTEGNKFRFYNDDGTYIKAKFDDPNYEYNSSRKQVVRCVENGKVYKSQTEAANDLGIRQNQVSLYLNHGEPCGYTFERIYE